MEWNGMEREFLCLIMTVGMKVGDTRKLYSFFFSFQMTVEMEKDIR
jgi:hypothetical protein